MQTEGKEDRRVRKTKRVLREGLAELLAKKSLRDISVTELTEKVDIHRSTFYCNFTDIFDLHKQIEDAVVQEIKDIFSASYTGDTKAFFEILFKYISDNRHVCRMYLGKNASPTFYGRLSELFIEAFLGCWRNDYGMEATAEELDYYVHFYLSGSLAVVGKWADEDFNYSTEQLIVMFADINDNFGDFIKNKLI